MKLPRLGNRVSSYHTADSQTRVEVRFDGEAALLSLGQLTELFRPDKVRHLQVHQKSFEAS